MFLRAKNFFWSVLEALPGRWYVLYASGHGSRYRRDGGLMTRTKALHEANRWRRIADTIGGQALVQNIFTKRIYDESGRGPLHPSCLKT